MGPAESIFNIQQQVKFYSQQFDQYQYFANYKRMQQSKKSELPLIQQSTIIEAFSILVDSRSNSQQISKVNNYLSQCQTNAQFPIALLRIFGTVKNPQVQLQALLLFTNVLKRNWQKKRNVTTGANLECKKQILRKGVLQVYAIKTPAYTKNLNQTIKYLTRQDYPDSYPELQDFMVNSLFSLEKDNQIITMLEGNQAAQAIGILSTIKKVVKEYICKRIYHEKSAFSKYIVQVIKALAGIQNLVYNYIHQLPQNAAKLSPKIIQNFFQAERKIDKIMLYSLLCAPTELQGQKDLTEIITRSFIKLQTFDQLLVKFPNFRQNIEKNIAAIIQNNAKIQNSYPFLFTNFLQGYLNSILSLAMNPKKFQSDDLHCALIVALTKPFQTFPYYMPQQQFRQSILYRKNASNFGQQQKRCYQQFARVFRPQILNGMFQKILSQIMDYFPDKNQQNELVFEDIDPTIDNSSEPTPNQLLMNLLKNMLRCFKNQCKPLLQQIFKTLINTQSDLGKSNLLIHFIELVLIMPKVYDSVELPMAYILELLKKLINNHQYLLFARIVKNYHETMDSAAIRECFSALTSIASQNQNIDPKSLYQCMITIKKIMKQHQQEQIPLENIPGCLKKIIQMFKFYASNPVLLWPLVHLTNQFVNSLSEQVLRQIFPQVIQHLDPVLNLSEGQQLLITGVSQLLHNLLAIVTPEIGSLVKCLVFVQKNLQNKNLETVTHLYRMWLNVVKLTSVETQSPQVTQFMYKLFEKHQNQLFGQEIEIYIQLIQEYMLSGVLNLSQEQLQGICSKIYNEKEENMKNNTGTKARILLPLFSLYFSYSIKNSCCSKNWIKLIMKEIKNLNLQISPHLNALRTLLLIIFHEHICRFGAQNIYKVLGQQWNDYRQWFSAYFWSMEYVSNKYAYKINSAGILASLPTMLQSQMLQTKIESNLPIDTIFKVLVIQLQPVKTVTGMHSYLNIFKTMDKADAGYNSLRTNGTKSRKINLQFLTNIAESDLTEPFKDVVTKLFRDWDWGQDDIRERFHKNVAEKIIRILNGNPQYKIDS